jgi:hypothetical protein
MDDDLKETLTESSRESEMILDIPHEGYELGKL